MKIVWSPIALERIEEIIEFISLDSEAVAKKVGKSIFGTIDRLKKFPKSGRIVPESKRPDIREVIKMGFRIIYQLENNRILVLTVRHSRRKYSLGEMVRARDVVVSDDPIKGLEM